MPPHDNGEFSVTLDLPPGTSLSAMDEFSARVDTQIRSNKEVKQTIMIVGGRDGESNVAQYYIELVPSKQRGMTTSAFKDIMREQLVPFKEANPKVSDVDMFAGGMRAFNINIIGNDLKELERVGGLVLERLKNYKGLKEPDINQRPGKPEFQVVVDNHKAEKLGVSTATIGMELRTHVAGMIPAVYRDNNVEYNIRVRLQDDQRNLAAGFKNTYVPNINYTMVRLADVATGVATDGPSTISRQNRGRYVQISADLESGVDLSKIMKDVGSIIENDVKLPPGMKYRFVGQAESFEELGINMSRALILGIIFIYLVLASLYESFVTPLTIMLVLPLAACGAFFGLYITGRTLDIFSMIGCIMLLGIATKNSILLVDYTNQKIAEGMDRSAAILEAGRVRLRPILMTTFALIAGMIPVAIGLNEASRQRSSMGIAIISGLISSTFLTLVVIPASFSYIDRFRLFSLKLVKRLLTPKNSKE